MKLRQELTKFLNIDLHDQPISYEIIETVNFVDYERHLIQYLGTENDEIRAYLFIPLIRKIRGAVLVHHQHNGERHLGKSEVSGIIGDKYQFFCEALCKKGIVTLAPDSISFEDRRTNKTGTSVDTEDNDTLQHYNEMAYRLLRGETLMKKVIEDSSIAISLLKYNKQFKTDRIGILGHSYGGNTVIFHSALDTRIKFICSSGAVCSYKNKFENNTGIELAEVIPGLTAKYDIIDLLYCIYPRALLIASGTEDIYALDARSQYEKLKKFYDEKGNTDLLELKEYVGGHPLNKERFDDIVKWFDNLV